jgi:hypothetical protein
MRGIDRFIEKTSTGFLIFFGLATCMPLFLALDLPRANDLLMSGLLAHTEASVPALRHWGIMVCGIGVLMLVSAFRPHLRFETMVFSALEKAFMVYLYLNCMDQPWSKAYVVGAIIDSTIVVYSLIYFISSHGRPDRWVKRSGTAPL